MSTVDTSLLSSVSSTSTSTSSSNQITQEDFLEIMLAQLANQDPSNPEDTSELVSQITDYSMLASLQNIESIVSSLSESLLSSQALQSSSLLGSQVSVYSSSGTLSDDTPLSGAVELTESVSDLTVHIYDSDGAEVQTLELGAQSAGEIAFSWSGMTDDQSQAAAGNYSVIAEGTVDGDSEIFTTRMTLTVTGVGVGDESSVYLSDGSKVALSDILTIA